MPRGRGRSPAAGAPPESDPAVQFDAVLMQSTPSAWVERKRFIPDTWTREPKPWSFKYREWQRQIMDDFSPRIVIEKAAQMGVTEIAMSRAMHLVDACGRDVLYLFPRVDDVTDFSAGRFDTMLQMSPELAAAFQDVSNVQLKRAGKTCLYMRGSNSRAGLKSIPVSVLVLDEFDEIEHKSVSLVRKRLLGAANTWELDLSTPRHPGVGIDREYQETDQHRWRVPCPHCGERQTLEFPANIKLPADLERDDLAKWCCSVCDEAWTEDERLQILDLGEWVPDNPSARVRGYHISQLYSPVATASSLCKAWAEAQRSEEEMEEFQNSHLGLPYQPKGAKITPAVVESCRGSHHAGARRSAEGACLGIDVGSRLDYEVWVPGKSGPVVTMADTVDWDGLDLLMREHRIEVAVMDAAPEREKAAEFRDRWSGQVWLANYPDTEFMAGREVRWNDDSFAVDVHRTAFGDKIAAHLFERTISFPADMPRRVIRHLAAVYRVVETDPKGRQRAKWLHRGPDHQFHAAIYAAVAYSRVADELGELDGLDLDSSSPADDDDGGWIHQGGDAAWGSGGDDWNDGGF